MFDKFEEAVKETAMIEELTESTLMSDFDSLTRAEIITLAEDMFSVSITNKDLMQLETFKDLQELIKGRRQ